LGPENQSSAVATIRTRRRETAWACMSAANPYRQVVPPRRRRPPQSPRLLPGDGRSADSGRESLLHCQHTGHNILHAGPMSHLFHDHANAPRIPAAYSHWHVSFEHATRAQSAIRKLGAQPTRNSQNYKNSNISPSVGHPSVFPEDRTTIGWRSRGGIAPATPVRTTVTVLGAIVTGSWISQHQPAVAT